MRGGSHASLSMEWPSASIEPPEPLIIASPLDDHSMAKSGLFSSASAEHRPAEYQQRACLISPLG
jgi:hypothetical protein